MSAYTPERAVELLRAWGYEPVLLQSFGGADEITGAHADMQMCRAGNSLIRAENSLPKEYPGCAAYNALVLGKYFVHRLDCTAPELLEKAIEQGLELINVRQGYAKCACVVVDGESIITADEGIIAALKGKVDILRITPGHVDLPGYEYGFLGGASGRIGDTVLFCGELDRHPDAADIRDFIEKRGLKIRQIPDLPLTDIGTFIE